MNYFLSWTVFSVVSDSKPDNKLYKLHGSIKYVFTKCMTECTSHCGIGSHVAVCGYLSNSSKITWTYYWLLLSHVNEALKNSGVYSK